MPSHVGDGCHAGGGTRHSSAFEWILPSIFPNPLMNRFPNPRERFYFCYIKLTVLISATAGLTPWDRRTPVRHRYSTSAQHCANTTARDRRTPVRQRPFATPSRSHKYLQYELVFRAIPSLRVSRGLHCHIPAGLTPWDRRTLVRHHRYSASAQL